MKKRDIEMLQRCTLEILAWLAKATDEAVVVHLAGLTVEIRRLLDKYDIKE